MATRLAEVMSRKNVKPRQLARELDLSISYIHRLMNGERQPSIKTGTAIARVLGADFADLFLDSDNTPSIKTSKSA